MWALCAKAVILTCLLASVAGQMMVTLQPAPLPAANATTGMDACVPFPAPDAATLQAQINHGETNPALLNTLVAAVDFARVFPDSKTVVDMPLKASPQEVADAYNALGLPDPLKNPQVFMTNQTINQTLQDFVNKWLSAPGTEVIPPPVNYTSGQLPEWLLNVSNPDAREWGIYTFNLFSNLTRIIDPKVAENPDRYTMIPVPNPFVIPGARFREAYYWDSLWIEKGLLAVGLTDLAHNMVMNFASLIRRFGFVPNGIRTYYINRSQPPVFSQMVVDLYQATGDTSMLYNVLPTVLRQYIFFTSPPKQVTVMGPDGTPYQLSRYYAAWDQPRPESYREDALTATQAGFDIANPTQATRQLYLDLASGAESGWDYSTRWLAEGSTNLTTVRTTHVIPADLNAMLYQTEANIAAMAEALGCDDLADRFRGLAAERAEAIMATMWDPQEGQWFDLICEEQGNMATAPAPEGDMLGSGNAALYQAAAVSPAAEPTITTQETVCRVNRSSVVSASNWVPLWAGVVSPNSTEAEQAVESFISLGFNQIGGIPVTLTESGQQWDYPNVWPPVSDMLIEGIARVPGYEGLAAELAQRFLDQGIATYKELGFNVEKGNATMLGRPGGGGEYETVIGFGWTNGVALSLLRTYGYNGSVAAPAMAPMSEPMTGR